MRHLLATRSVPFLAPDADTAGSGDPTAAPETPAPVEPLAPPAAAADGPAVSHATAAKRKAASSSAERDSLAKDFHAALLANGQFSVGVQLAEDGICEKYAALAYKHADTHLAARAKGPAA